MFWVAWFFDEHALRGSTIARALSALAPGAATWSCVSGGVEGAGIPDALLRDGARHPLPRLSRLCASVVQFDWADFYLFRRARPPAAFRWAPRRPVELVPACDVLVRAVDSSYLYAFADGARGDALRASGLPWDAIERVDPSTFGFPD